MSFRFQYLPGDDRMRVIDTVADRHIGFVAEKTWLGEHVWQPYLNNGDPLIGVSTLRILAAQRLKDYYDFRGGATE